MCGLAGCFTSSNVKLNKARRLQRAKVVEGLLIANQVRGTDSTGVAAIDFTGQFDVLKVAEEPWDFVRRKETQALLRSDASIFIGHTRMSSMPGDDVTDANAHPFVEGKVVGAHNGVINNYLEIDKTVNVDSQAVFRLLDEHPDNMDFVFQQVSGSCALTWYDQRDPLGLYLVAHQNPLAAAIIPSIETVFWSSQSEHLEPIMRAVYGSDVQFIDIKRDTVYRLEATDVYEWQEAKATFRGARGVYKYNGQTYGYDAYDRDDEWWYEQYGIPRGAFDDDNSSVATKSDKDEGEGKAEGQLNLPATIPPEIMAEEDRYDDYWNRLMGDGSQSESDENSDEQPSGSGDENNSRLHELSDRQYQRLESGDRFGMDLVDDLNCGYCDKPAGDRAVWDDGLQMMLCKPCQNWWDNHGSALPGNYPEATA